MSSKRVVAKEWKRKKKKQQLISRLSIVAICILAVLGMAYIGWDMWSRTYVMTFEGQRISRGYMQYFSVFNDWMSDPTEQALDNLTQFLIIEQAARRHNVTLTEEEMEDAAETLETIQSHLEMMGLSPNLSQERMEELAQWNGFTRRLMDIYSEDLVVDEDEFEEAFQQFLTWNRADFVEMEFKYHHSTTMDAAFTVWGEFSEVDPEDFDDIILRDFQLETGLDIDDLDVPTISLEELRTDPAYAQVNINNLAALEVGGFSEPIPVGEDSFFIFIPTSVERTPEAEIAEIYREDYIEMLQADIVWEKIEEWREAADIQINERGANAALPF